MDAGILSKVARALKFEAHRALKKHLWFEVTDTQDPAEKVEKCYGCGRVRTTTSDGETYSAYPSERCHWQMYDGQYKKIKFPRRSGRHGW